MRGAVYAVVIFVLIAGGYFFWWTHVSERMLVEAEEWEQARKNEGYEITHAPFELSGFPYRIKLSAGKIDIRKPTDDAAPELTMQGFWLVVQPWNITRFVFGTSGALGASWRHEGGKRAMTMQPQSLLGSGSVSLDGRMKTLAIDIQKANYDFNWRPSLTIDRSQLHARPAPESVDEDIEVALQIARIELAETEGFSLGPTIETVDAIGVFKGKIQRGDLKTGFENWRDKGGVLEISKIDVTWGPAAIQANGALTLDELMRPLGAFSAKISGYRKILQALAMSGQVPVQMAATTVFGLDLLAKPDDQGVKTLTLPVTAQDGGLYLGPVKLMPLAPVLKH